jgi:drug/metabolite transporter (DMT)-like permease
MSQDRSEQGGGAGLGVVTILLTLAGWTSIPLFLKHFAGAIDPWTANGWRYGISALLWLPPLLWSARRGTLPPGLWRAALWPSLWNIIAQIGFGMAPYYVSPGLMTFSLRVNIVVLTIGSALLFAAERRVIRHPAFLAGLLLVVGGAAMTVVLQPGGLGGGTGLGVGLAVMSGVLYAFYALAVRRSMMGMHPLTAFAAVNQLTGLGLVGCMLAFGHSKATGVWNAGADVLAMAAGQFGLLAISAVVGIGLGHTFFFLSISRLGLAVASAVVQLQPITVSIASMALFGDRLTAWQWVFGLLAIVGAGLILWTQSRVTSTPRRAAAPAGPIESLSRN